MSIPTLLNTNVYHLNKHKVIKSGAEISLNYCFSNVIFSPRIKQFQCLHTHKQIVGVWDCAKCFKSIWYSFTPRNTENYTPTNRKPKKKKNDATFCWYKDSDTIIALGQQIFKLHSILLHIHRGKVLRFSYILPFRTFVFWFKLWLYSEHMW